jgi:hypothetical protein
MKFAIQPYVSIEESRVSRYDAWGLTGTFLFNLASYPFAVLQQMAGAVVILFERVPLQTDFQRPEWSMQGKPILMLDGKRFAKFRVEAIDTSSYLFPIFHSGLWGSAEAVLSDDPNDRDAKCTANVPIRWDESGAISDQAVSPAVVRIIRNSVNFVHVKASRNSERGKGKLEIQVIGCNAS